MIGVFDSGIGGLTVVKALLERIPEYDLIYFGDTARTPYGTKSAETVIAYALENVEFLLNQGAKMIVMACNTASSVATERVLEKFNVPIFEVITPAVELAHKATRNFQVGVIGTRATIASGVYPEKLTALNPATKVYSVACPLLVPIVEEGWGDKPETVMIIKKYLKVLKTRQIDTLILGCTHYPLLKNSIQRKIGKRVRVIDSSVAVAIKVDQFLRADTKISHRFGKNRSLRLIVSDATEQFEKTARLTLKQRVNLECIKVT